MATSLSGNTSSRSAIFHVSFTPSPLGVITLGTKTFFSSFTMIVMYAVSLHPVEASETVNEYVMVFSGLAVNVSQEILTQLKPVIGSQTNKEFGISEVAVRSTN